MIAYQCEISKLRGSSFPANLSPPTWRNYVSTKITRAYARLARRRAPECPAFHRSAQCRRQSRIRGINALKHGTYVRDENRHKTMLALGEDPEQLQTLTEELMSAYGPGDALYQKQVEDLAWLYSRRDRLERVQDGLRRRAVQAIDGWQHHRQQEMARVTFDSSQHLMIDVDLPDSTDRGVMLRKTISYLELVREEVKQRTFRQRQYSILEDLYRGLGIKGWRMGLIFRLLHRFGDPIQIQDQQADEEWKAFLRRQGDNCDVPGEPEREELLRLLGEEIASVKEEFEYAEMANAERAELERDACLAPEGETWVMLLRQEASLDRSIDRKVRILMRLRKELANPLLAPPGEGGDERMETTDEIPDEDTMPKNSPGVEAVEDSKMNEQCANVIENKQSGSANTGISANGTEKKGSYAQEPGMLMKTKAVIESTELCEARQ